MGGHDRAKQCFTGFIGRDSSAAAKGIAPHHRTVSTCPKVPEASPARWSLELRARCGHGASYFANSLSIVRCTEARPGIPAVGGRGRRGDFDSGRCARKGERSSYKLLSVTFTIA